MAEYIERNAAIEYLTLNMGWHNEDGDPVDDWDERKAAISDLINGIPAADVRPVVRGKNIGTDYDEVDQFVCSECGIELQGWVRVERDEDTWEVTYHEHRLNFCPNCGCAMEES